MEKVSLLLFRITLLLSIASHTINTALGCSLGSGTTDGFITAYISAEVKGTSAAARRAVDTLDDAWRTASGLPTTGTVVPWFGYTAIDPIANSAPALFRTNGVNVDVDFVNIEPVNSCEGTLNSRGAPALTKATRLQGSSPRPASLYDTSNQPAYWNEVPPDGNNGSPNAVRFTFATPVSSFGAWFGDLETRSDGHAAPAYLRLLDSSGNRIGADIAIAPTTIIDGGVSSTVDQSQCGNTATNRGCGNGSTRWVGFVDHANVARVKQVLVMVGDDDFGDSAELEHLSFIGADIVPIKDFSDVKDPLFSPDNTGSILPNNVVFYNHQFKANSTGNVAFSSNNTGNVTTGWSSVLYQDTNCNNILDGAEGNTPIAANISTVANDTICLINKVYAPATVSDGETYSNVINAEFNFNHNAIAGTTTLTVTDLTRAAANDTRSEVGTSRLALRKTVENITQGTAETETQNQAKPEDVLKYRIYYSNTGTGVLTDLIINDEIPAFTTINGASVCEMPLPASLTNCTPSVNGSAIKWAFPVTDSLQGGAGGVVSYEVIID